MTTSLDKQLLQVKEKIHYVDVSKKRDSLLFGAVEAANIDLDSVLAMGQEGLSELINIDSRFKCFQLTLFSENSKSFNRILENKIENDKIDLEINKFLELQSNYFLLSSAHKSLEWLIRRYRINEFNIDSIISSIIPYHESNIFAKFLSILRFEFNKKWQFLTGVQENKVYIPREYFISVVGSHPFFLDFIYSTIETYDKKDVMSKPLVSFFTAFLIELLSVKTTPYIRDTLSCLTKCLKSKNSDLQLSAYMVLSIIASKVTLSKDVVELLFKTTLKHCANNFNQAFTFLMVLFQKQKFDSLPNETLQTLVSIPALFEILLDFNSQEKSLDRVLLILFKYLSSNCIESAECYTLLTQLIGELLPISNQYHVLIFNQLTQTYLATASNKDEVDEPVINVLRLLNSEIVQDEFKKLSKNSKQKQKEIIKLQKSVLQQKTITTSSSNTIFLKLQSNIPSERKEGLILFKKEYCLEESSKSSTTTTTTTIDFNNISKSFSTTIYQRLVDCDGSIIKEAWNLPSLDLIVSPKELIKASIEFFKVQSFVSDKKLLDTVLSTVISVVSQSSISLIPDLTSILFSQILENNNSTTSSIIKKLNKDIHPIFNNITNQSNSNIESLIKIISTNVDKESNINFINQISKSNFSTFKSDIFIILILLNSIISCNNNKNKNNSNNNNNLIYQMFNIIVEISKSYLSKESTINNINNIQEVYKIINENNNSLKQQVSLICSLLSITVDSLFTISPEQFMKQLQQPSNTAATTEEKMISEIQKLCKLIFNSKITNIDLLLRGIVMKFFGNQLVFFKFLSQYWGHDDITTVYQSLCLSKILVNSKSFNRYLISNNQAIAIIPYLLLLKNQESSIRSTSLDSIQEIYKQIKSSSFEAISSTTSSNKLNFYGSTKQQPTIELKVLIKFLGQLVQYKNEITMDKTFLDNYFSRVLFNAQVNTVGSSSVASSSSDNESDEELTKMTKEDIQSIGKFLISSSLLVESLSSRLIMLQSLQSIKDDVTFVEVTISYITELLEKVKNSSLSYDESLILDILLKRLGQTSVLTNPKTKKQSLSLFISSLSISNELDIINNDNNTIKYTPLFALIGSINKSLLLTVPVKEQIGIVEKILSYFFSESNQIKQLAKNTLLSVLVDATVILPMLLPEKQQQQQQQSTDSTLPIPRYNSLFELIRLNSSKINGSSILVTPILAIIKNMETIVNQTVEKDALEYCKQLAMASLGAIIDCSIAKDIKTLESSFDVSIIIKCVESSNNLQTCSSALVLLSNMASKFPQKLFKFMESIIKMIKFVLVNGDDNFSFMILERFLTQLLPNFVKQGISLVQIFGLFLESFSSIPKKFRLQLFNCICQSVSYKQLHILFSLILTKKIQDLRIITNKLKHLDKDTIMSSDEQIKEEVDYEQFNEFISLFSDQIPVLEMSTSLGALCQTINLISIESGSCVEAVSEEEEEICSLLSRNNSKDNRLLQANTLDFICERLSSKVYLDNFSFNLDSEQKEVVEAKYLWAFENLLVLLKKTTEYSEKTANIKLNGSANSISIASGKDKFIKKLLSSVNLCMDRYSQLLSVKGFISTITQLLNHSDSNVRRRSLVIFNEKITLVKDDLTQDEVNQFLSLIDSFTRIIDSQTETETNKQTSLLSFEILARNFSTTNATAFLSQIPTIIKSMGHSSHQVVSSSLICIATLCSELQAKTIPYIPQFFPVLLNTLTGSYKTNVEEENETRTLLQISCISSLEMMLNTISKFLSPYLPQLLNALLHPRLTSNSLLSGKLFAQVKRLLTILTKNVEFRLLLPAMFSAYEFAVQSENDQSLICLFDFVGDISANLGPKDIALHHKSIFKFYLQCFEFRKKYKNRVKNADKVEDHIISSFMTLVMKLNENLFKPLFIKVLDWALNIQGGNQQQNGKHSDDDENGSDDEDDEEDTPKKKKLLNGKSKPTPNQPEKSKDNLLFFYKIVNSLALNLKTIFVPYFGYFLDDSIRQLQNIYSNIPFSQQPQQQQNINTVNDNTNTNTITLLNNNNTNNKRKKNQNITTITTNSNNNNNNNNLNSIDQDESILCFVISALEKCFIYDTDGFLDKQKFEQILPALVNQLENQMGTVESYKQRVSRYIAPSITQLAVAINQDLLWKHLNHTVLMKTRSPYSIVRYSSMVVIQSLHKKMGEQLLILLPETIPFISELLEDSVPEVEQITQDVVKIIETHLGAEESISSYL
ncbi:hypothetical protein RB653_000543 [Dictyostelium firmibasis]|uniref:HEAT repeat-containing protein 1 n=1 Tax=Dictyostelium firmibasis TaxID=79012 RepID=A0AAN7U2W8_9MYCE